MNSSERPSPSKTAIAGILVVTVACVALVAYLKACGSVEKSVDRGIRFGEKVLAKLPEIAARFRTGTITETFRSYLPSTSSTLGDVLELAQSTSNEHFKREDNRKLAWDHLNLGTTTAEIQAPVTFRYHLRLSGTWRLATRGNVCIVEAPPILPSLPAAIDTGGLQKKAENGWFRLDKTQVLEALEKSMTSVLNERAMDSLHVSSVRQDCRKSVAEFVKSWLLKEDQWRTNGLSEIVVVFPDEAKVDSDVELQGLDHRPVIKLGD